MRQTLLAAAVLNGVLLGLFFLSLPAGPTPLAIVCWAGVLTAAVVAVLLTWRSHGVTMLATGLLGCAAGLTGWGSWLYFWWTADIGPVINLWGLIGPVTAAALFTVSALLVSRRR
ncbi:hypothetical protein [Corynebacterium halotolerans]|uniref:Uncharacterized protein n=1 Tax=Corynebacterium halotolerans YIM 70093 = DSM 44683 TaxID=1121362 RepID=M1NLI5_9CORY|nr:hypothetical protein [Corynebacterium halotolerans]AGF72273.1 hypothetical protein A605_06335 [Corynebacterium halotolerans YIM 70093 = DSM 44683]